MKDQNSVVSAHMMEYKHQFDFANTKILDQEQSWHSRIFLESAHINCTKNTINKKEDTQGLNRIYKTLLNKL